MDKRKNKMDQIDKIMAFEEGNLSRKDTIQLFQELLESGLVWQLQGFYGRMARDLIQAGLIAQPAQN
jgi:hypothetical protein